MSDILSPDFGESYSAAQIRAEAQAVTEEFHDIFDCYFPQTRPGFYTTKSLVCYLRRGADARIHKHLVQATAEGKVVQGTKMQSGREVPVYALADCREPIDTPGVIELWREALGVNDPVRKRGEHTIAELAKAWQKTNPTVKRIVYNAMNEGALACGERWVPNVGLTTVYWIPKEEEE